MSDITTIKQLREKVVAPDLEELFNFMVNIIETEHEELGKYANKKRQLEEEFNRMVRRWKAEWSRIRAEKD